MRTYVRPARGLALLAALLCGAFVASAAHATLDGPIAFTEGGLVVGTSTDTVNAFRGIPYAAPPVGDLRWQPPQPAEAWQGIRDATAFANHCPQPPSPFGTATVTEDCLYLNVYAPRKGVPFLRPVMVWFHGGALYLGESDTYDPRRLVEEGVVVVTINYRLGELGFLAHPALTAESSYGGSGNYGIMDQQAALRWVQRNILFFGGNPLQVTIFGQSAGGLSVHTNIASPQAEGLFDRAIIQSGAYALDQAPLAVAEAVGQGFAAGAGCADQSAVCLRGLTVQEILANQPGGGFVPNLDNFVLTQTVRSALTSGEFNQVPVMEGSTHDEWRLFVALTELQTGVPLSEAAYPFAIAATLGVSQPVANLIAGLYPAASYPSPSEALGAVGTDAIFACNSRRSIQLLSQHVLRVYGYEFNDPTAPSTALPQFLLSFPLGAYHASEVAYVFDTAGVAFEDRLNEDQQELANVIVDYWTQFARFGIPNQWRTPLWRRYKAENDNFQSLVLSGPEPTTGFAADHMCDFWTPPLP